MNNQLKTRTIIAIAAVIMVVALGSVVLLSPILTASHTSTTTTAPPCVQKAYLNGKTYCFTVTRAITSASQGAIASVQTVYVVTYPQLNSVCNGDLSSCKAESLPSGYSPQCNPCVQEAPSIYHDHVLAALPIHQAQGPQGDEVRFEVEKNRARRYGKGKTLFGAPGIRF